MALARVQTTAKVSGAGTASVAIPFSTPPTVGNALVVPVAAVANGIVIPSSCTDNYGNTYALATSQVQTVGTDTSATIYVCEKLTASGASFTITITFAATVAYAACAIEVSGGTFGLVLDKTAGAIGSSTTPATGATAALTAAEEFVVALHCIGTTQATITVAVVSPTWTQEFENLSSVQAAGEADSRILTSASGTTTSASWTDASTGNWAAALATFRAVTTAPISRTTQSSIELLSQPLLPASRVTAATIEILSTTAATLAEGRITQSLVELLSAIPYAVVPDLTGLTLAEATTALTAAGLTVGTTTGDPAGFVTAQSPAPGTHVDPGSAVDLTLALPIAEGRITQDVIEVLGQVEPIPARVTALSVDVHYTGPAETSTTQLALEVSTRPVVTLRESQAATEVLRQFAGTARETHAAVELRKGGAGAARASQLVVELFVILPPCVPNYFPIDSDDFVASPPTAYAVPDWPAGGD